MFLTPVSLISEQSTKHKVSLISEQSTMRKVHKCHSEAEAEDGHETFMATVT